MKSQGISYPNARAGRVEEALMPLMANMWRQICQEASRQRAEEGAFLTPLGFAVIKQAIGQQRGEDELIKQAKALKT